MPHTLTTGWNSRCPSCDLAIVLVLEIARSADDIPIGLQLWTCPACDSTHSQRLVGEIVAVKRRDALEDEIAMGLTG